MDTTPQRALGLLAQAREQLPTLLQTLRTWPWFDTLRTRFRAFAKTTWG